MYGMQGMSSDVPEVRSVLDASCWSWLLRTTEDSGGSSNMPVRYAGHEQ
jgi:hypothetical protein